MKTAVLYALCGAETAKAEAERIRGACGGCRLVLVSDAMPEAGAPWADIVMDSCGLEKFKSKGASRPDLFVLAISSEAGKFSFKKLFSALVVLLSLRPLDKRAVFYSWSGRRGLREGAALAARRALAAAFRPLHVAGLRLAYAAGEALFPLLNGKPRGKGVKAGGPGRMLAISLDLIGDLVWVAPAIAAIKKSCPDMEVHLLVANRNAGLAKMVEGVDRVIGYDAPWLKKIHDPSGMGGWKPNRIKSLLTRMRLFRGEYNVTIDFRGEPGDDALAYLTGAPFRAGVAGTPVGALRTEDTSFLLTRRLAPEPGEHILERGLRLVGSLGFNAAPPEAWLKPSDEEENKVRALLGSNGVKPGELLVGMQPGASRPEKRWNSDGFIEVANRLKEKYGARIILAGSAREMALCDEIAGKVGGSLNLAGSTSITGFVSLIKACDYFITNDTSAISIASAVKTPVLALMLTGPWHLGPYRVKSAVVQKRPSCWNPLDGGLCFCPYGYRCLQEITPEEVVAAFDRLSGKI